MIEHNAGQRFETAIVALGIETLQQRMAHIDLEDRLAVRQRLAAGLQHLPELRTQVVVRCHYAGGRIDETLADVDGLDTLGEYLANLLQQRLVFLVGLLVERLGLLGLSGSLLCRVDESPFLLFGETVCKPGVDPIRQQQHLDTVGFQLLDMRTGFRRLDVLRQQVIDLVLVCSSRVLVIIQSTRLAFVVECR